MANHLGQQLRELRLRAKRSQQEVAAAAQITQGGLSMIENGHRWPERSTLDRLIAVLDPTPTIQLPGATAERR